MLRLLRIWRCIESSESQTVTEYCLKHRVRDKEMIQDNMTIRDEIPNELIPVLMLKKDLSGQQ